MIKITEVQSEASTTKKINITCCQIELIKPNNGMIGFASILVNDSIFLSSIAIHKKLNAEGYRITYPSKGQFSIFYPINKEVSRQIEGAIFEKLEEVMIKSKGYVQIL